MKLPAYQPRQSVPWKAPDVVLLLIVYLILPFGIFRAAQACVPMPIAKPAADAPEENTHPLGRILTESQKGEGDWPFVVGIAMAIVLAPVAEELLFRLLLQGWLESAVRRLRPQLGWPRRCCDAVPIVISSVVFAAIHVRSAMPRQELSTLIYFLGVQTAANVLAIGAIVGWLGLAAKAKPVDLGVDFRALRSDIAVGLAAAPLVIGVTFVARVSAGLLFPAIIKYSWSDPVFLLPLALTLGFLYYRTHRIVPSIVLHSAFNTVLGVLMAILSLIRF
jgi:membrane protease YdiL (CAAX protease family)